MNKQCDLVEKALLAINSSNFIEKIANQEFANLDKLQNLPWSLETEKDIENTIKKIKSLLLKSEIEYKNLENLEKELHKFIDSKKPRKP